MEIKKEEIDPWLITISGNLPAEINVEGKWHDPESFGPFGWGEGTIRQSGNRLSGYIGNYNVQGIVSGEIVYLVFHTGGRVYYTAKLKMFERNVLEGQYFQARDREQKDGHPTNIVINKN